MSLNAAATPFVSASPYEVNTPYDVEQHLYDTPAAIAQDNEMAQQFLREHNAPDHIWEQAGHYKPLLDLQERDREERIAKLEKRLDVMYVVVNSLNEDFSHFALEHWKPFQESLFRYFGHRCHGAFCTDAAPHSPVVPPPSPGSGSPSSPVPSLESCSSFSDGEANLEEDSSESNDSYWSVLSAVEQVTTGSNAVEVRDIETAGQVWFGLGSGGVRAGVEGDE
jgi:hypothetical protein